MTERIWVDTDPSVACRGCEVDDGYALLHLLANLDVAGTGYSLAGVSAVFGNASLETTWIVAQQLLESASVPGVVHAGAAGPEELGNDSPALRAMASALRANQLTLLALGPLTTIASLILRHPDLCSQIRQVVAVAGRRPGQKLEESAWGPPHRDFNFELDPEAFSVVLRSGIPMTLVPWEAARDFWVEAADLNFLASGSPASQWLAAASWDWLQLWQSKYRVHGFHPFDALAGGFLTHPDLFDREVLPARIKVVSNDRNLAGEPSRKPMLLVSRAFRRAPRVVYVTGVRPEFKALLLAAIREVGKTVEIAAT